MDTEENSTTTMVPKSPAIQYTLESSKETRVYEVLYRKRKPSAMDNTGVPNVAASCRRGGRSQGGEDDLFRTYISQQERMLYQEYVKKGMSPSHRKYHVHYRQSQLKSAFKGDVIREEGFSDYDIPVCHGEKSNCQEKCYKHKRWQEYNYSETNNYNAMNTSMTEIENVLQERNNNIKNMAIDLSRKGYREEFGEHQSGNALEQSLMEYPTVTGEDTEVTGDQCIQGMDK